MANPGRVHASALSAIQETTLALANINFDFSLYKVEPPSEYKTIGKLLSPTRQEAAEYGSLHVVARKLHALFADELPSTPHLLAAYGVRATEIVESEAFNPRGRAEDGIFQHWIGADGTSLWAAATSGRAAIAVHLLACMLARLFTAPEATAVWEELVISRKNELSSVDATEPLLLSKIAAAQVEITRQQLSSWDASARAWLTVADKARQRQQIQAMLLIKHSILPVSQKMNVQKSVMEVWKSALLNLEKIISGVPCNVTEGAVLLALGSWHIYPNLHVLGAGHEIVDQADCLVAKGGLVTIGASSHSPDAESGVYWSIPLAYLRFYGDPVPVSRNLAESFGRLSSSELFLVTLGSVFSSWKKSGDSIEKASTLVSRLSAYLSANYQLAGPKGTHWLHYLGEAAKDLLSAKNLQLEHYRSLVGRGQRHYSRFLCDISLHPTPMFGISTIHTLLQLVAEDEKKIETLRFMCASLSVRPDSLIIRYKAWKDVAPRLISEFDQLDAEIDLPREEGWSETLVFEEPREQNHAWEYASAMQSTSIGKKRKWTADDSLVGHVRWTERTLDEIKNTAPTHRRGEEFSPLSNVYVSDQTSMSFHWKPMLSHLTATRKTESQSTRFEFVMGDPSSAAIFKRSDINLRTTNDLDIDTLLEVLDRQWIDCRYLMQHIDDQGAYESSSNMVSTYTRSLRAIAAAGDVYKLMPNATISTGAFTRPLHQAIWTQFLHEEVLRGMLNKRSQGYAR
jgi:hypothetical protein